MSAQSAIKMRLLPLTADIGLVGASESVAAEPRVATDTTVAVSDEFQILVTPGGRLKVVDSEGYIHFLTGLTGMEDRTVLQESPQYSYIKPTRH
jgi:hypothetical protein